MTPCILTFIDDQELSVVLDFPAWLELWRTGRFQERIVKKLVVNDFPVRFL